MKEISELHNYRVTVSFRQFNINHPLLLLHV